MSEAILATGTLIYVGNGASPETFTAIAEVKSISGPNLSRNVIDVTTHNSTLGWEESLAGLKRSGEITFDINFIPGNATHSASTGLLKAFDDNDKLNYKLVFPISAGSPQVEWTFEAYVVGFQIGAEVDGVLNASLTLKPAGTVVLA